MPDQVQNGEIRDRTTGRRPVGKAEAPRQAALKKYRGYLKGLKGRDPDKLVDQMRCG